MKVQFKTNLRFTPRAFLLWGFTQHRVRVGFRFGLRSGLGIMVSGDLGLIYKYDQTLPYFSQMLTLNQIPILSQNQGWPSQSRTPARTFHHRWGKNTKKRKMFVLSHEVSPYLPLRAKCRKYPHVALFCPWEENMNPSYTLQTKAFLCFISRPLQIVIKISWNSKSKFHWTSKKSSSSSGHFFDFFPWNLKYHEIS